MIDSHHHLWLYDPSEYAWIREDMNVLRRDYGMEDLRPLMAAHGIEGLVTVQVRQTLAETEWLLDLADRHPEIAGVVGWVPLADPRVGELLEHLSARPRLKGVRHVLQDEADEHFMLRDDFNRGVATLGRFGMAYDILIYERHLPQTIAFVDRHPDQVFVLDHLAKPRIRDGVISPWRERMLELAKRPHVFCKISGLATEAAWGAWTEADLAPYIDVALEAFGSRRLMFGSDWPVLLLAGDYGRWVDSFHRAIHALSPHEREWVTHRTARTAYRLI